MSYDNNLETEIFSSVVFILDLILVIVYSFLMYLEIKKYESTRNQNFSNFEHKNLGWLRFILIAHIIYYIFPISWGFLIRFTNIDPDFQIARIAAGSTTIIFYLSILWKVTTHSDDTEAIEKKTYYNKYKSSKLEEKEKKELRIRLRSYMQNDQPFLENNITLADISNALNTPTRQVSQVINEELSQNFYEFINYYRIEYAKNLLRSTVKSEMTIAQIMYASGFNSKSSFHTAFRKATNQTPSSFRKM